MSLDAEPWTWESAQDILDYLEFAGFLTTRDQLARLHRRRLINPPFQDPHSDQAAFSRFPSGTAERTLRLSQLRGTTKQLDELAWRLWWEGYDVEPDLIRAYLLKRAARWDEQHREVRRVSSSSGVELKGERNVLEEVFFEHLKTGPALVSARRRLSRGSELYSEFAALLIDLVRGDLSFMDQVGRGLFEGTPEGLFAKPGGTDENRRVGLQALDAMRSGIDTPFIEVVGQLDDKEIANARPIALRLLGLVANVGTIVHDVFGGVGHGRDNVGKSLVSMAESSEEQVIALFLTSSFLRENRVRESLSEISLCPVRHPPISFIDFLRLRYLAVEVPGLVSVIAPESVRPAFTSHEEAVQWRQSFDEFWFDHYFEIQEAMAKRPDLFNESALEESECKERDFEEYDVKVKKKILNEIFN